MTSCCQKRFQSPEIFLSSIIKFSESTYNSNPASFFFTPSSNEAFYLTHGIVEFQKDIDSAKDTRINFQLQVLIYNIFSSFDLQDPLLRTPFKQEIRIAKASTSSFYNNFWLTSPNAFVQAVAHFECITASVSRLLQKIDPTLE